MNISAFMAALYGMAGMQAPQINFKQPTIYRQSDADRDSQLAAAQAKRERKNAKRAAIAARGRQ